MAEALVSVIMPVHNGASFLPAALESVYTNGYPAVEVLLVDDASEDGSLELARSLPYPLKLIQADGARPGAPVGPAAARNTALRQAAGRYITFHDVDDRWPAGRLAAHVAVLEADADLGIAQGRVQRVRLSGDAANWHEQFELRPYYFVNLGSLTCRRDLFTQLGLFDETLRYNEDTDWVFRAWEQRIPKHLLPEIALFYRIHRSNMTHEFHTIPGSGLPRLFHRHILRQRSGQAIPRSIDDLSDYIGWSDLSAAERESRAVHGGQP